MPGLETVEIIMVGVDSEDRRIGRYIEGRRRGWGGRKSLSLACWVFFNVCWCFVLPVCGQRHSVHGHAFLFHGSWSLGKVRVEYDGPWPGDLDSPGSFRKDVTEKDRGGYVL